MDGLLGSSIIGFHTQLHCNNFVDTADRFIECHIEREDATISVGEHSTQVRPYPISIAWPPPPLEDNRRCRNAVRMCSSATSGPQLRFLGVGVERLDFTKGIPERFRAIEIFLENHPEWVGRFVMLQVAAPSRNVLPLYQEVEKEILALAERINDRFEREGYRPIVLAIRHHERRRSMKSTALPISASSAACMTA